MRPLHRSQVVPAARRFVAESILELGASRERRHASWTWSSDREWLHRPGDTAHISRLLLEDDTPTGRNARPNLRPWRTVRRVAVPHRRHRPSSSDLPACRPRGQTRGRFSHPCRVGDDAVSTPIAVMDESLLRAIVAEELARLLGPIWDAIAAPVRTDDVLIDAKAFAAILGTNRRTLRRLVLEQAVPAPMRIGGRIPRWRRIDVERWIQSGCQPPLALSMPRSRGSIARVEAGT